MPTVDTPDDCRRLLRRTTLARRDQLAAAELAAKSAVVAARLGQLPALRQARTIFTYVHFKSEVQTLGLIETWLTAGKRVCVPLTLTAESRLVAYQITDPGRDLAPGYCRIPEPDPSRCQVVPAGEIDAIILPGSVFDLHGGRLGYGGGYYDRFIAQEAPTATRIGLAFELQVVPTLPLLAHDQPLHVLATEDRLLQFA